MSFVPKEAQLPAPKVCPYCGGPVVFANNDLIYGKSYGDWPYAYICAGATCDAYVGVHPNTEIPLGTLANKELRMLRKWAKNAFHVFLKYRGWNRKRGYPWLAKAMGLEKEHCHFGWFDADQCRQAQAILSDAIGGAATADFQ